MRRKETLVKDLSPGDEFEDLFVITELRSPPQPQTENFVLKFTLRDSSGTLRAHIFAESEARYRELHELLKLAYDQERVVLLKGVVVEYRGNPEARVQDFRVLEEGEFEEFSAVPALPPERIEELFNSLVNLVYNNLAQGEGSEFAKRIVTSFLGDWAFVAQLKRAPAARAYHHALVGGLLEHTYNVTRLALAAAQLYNESYSPKASIPLVVVGAALHDVGKVKEYRVSRRDIRKTPEGELLGHIVLGLQMVQERAKALGLSDDPHLPALLHVIASHHGSEELGSPVSPRFPEAFIVHFADDLDAKLAHIARQEELPVYSQMLRRTIFPTFGWEE